MATRVGTHSRSNITQPRPAFAAAFRAVATDSEMVYSAPMVAPSAEKLTTLAADWVAALPEEWQNPLAQFLDHVSRHNVDEIVRLAVAIGGVDLATLRFSPAQQTALANIWFAATRRCFETCPDFRFAGYLACLHEWQKVYGTWGHTVALGEQLEFMFRLTGGFSTAFFDDETQAVVCCDGVLDRHVTALIRCTESAGFATWISRAESIAFMRAMLDGWLALLGSLLQAGRGRPFETLYSQCIFLLRGQPELAPKFPDLKRLLVFACRLFPNQGFTVIRSHLGSCLATAPEDTKAFLMDLHAVLEAHESAASDQTADLTTELTVEYACRTAIEEVVGDGKITATEEQILETLWIQLGVQPQLYRGIVEQTKQRMLHGDVLVLTRDFSAEEYLFKVLVKAVEDGKITDDEKAIVQNICLALEIDRNTFARVFQRAKETRATRLANTPTDPDNPMFSALQTMLARRERLTALLQAPACRDAPADAVAAFMTSLPEHNDDPAAQRASGAGHPLAVAVFAHEPECFDLPVIGVLCPGHAIEKVRLQLVGGLISTYFIENTLVLHNRALDRELIVPAVATGSGFAAFGAGLAASAGRYLVIVADYPTLTPILVHECRGSLDFTGTLYGAMRDLVAGRIDAASDALTRLLDEAPHLQHVAHHLGLCHKARAAQGQDPEQNLRAAAALYHRELELAPESETALLSLAVIYKSIEKYEEALHFLERAVAQAPTSIPVLTTLATTRYNLQVSRGRPPRLAARAPVAGQPAGSDDLVTPLAQAFRLAPRHPAVVTLVDQFSALLKTDLRAHLRLAVCTAD